MMIPGSDKEPTPQEKVNSEWDAMAGEWDDIAAGYSKGFYKILWKATGLDPKDLQDKALVVDFGCGTGILTDRLRKVAAAVVSIDASARMVDVLHDKILSRQWNNVQAYCATLGNIVDADEGTQKAIAELEGQVDLIVASSVLTFIPSDDIEATMATIGRLLKSGGVFCHSDWPKSEAKHPDAMTAEKASKFFGMAGLREESAEIIKMDMGDDQSIEVFVGVARKP